MINRILELCAITFIVKACDGSLEPLIGIRQMCRTSMEVTCSLKNGNQEIWSIYRYTSLGNMQTIARIDDSKSKCNMRAFSKSTECNCIKTNRVNCTILGDIGAQAGYRWLCSIIKNNSHVESKPHTFEMAYFDECTRTYFPEMVTEKSNTSFTTRDIGRTADTEKVLKEMEESHPEDFPSVPNLVVYIVSGVATLALLILGVKCLCGIVRRWRPLHHNEIVSVPMEVHVVSDTELIDHTIQTTADETSSRSANSVHVYESIPPSPIADISFSGFAEDTEFDAVTDESIEDAGRYENLDQNTREEMAYNINCLDRNTREDVMNHIYSHGQHTEDTTHYINLNL